MLERWQEYFHSIFNRPEPNKKAPIHADTQYYHIHTDRPSIQEINNTISKMNNGKAPGADGISADQLQAEKFVTFTILSIFSCLKIGRLVWSWGLRKREICRIVTTGGVWPSWVSQAKCSVRTHSIELFTGNLEKDIRKGQAGFRKERSCTDHISTPGQISGQAKEWNGTVYANFIDFEISFNSIYREILGRIHYGIPSKKVNIVRMLYRDRQAQVICGNTLKEPVIFQTAHAYCLRSYLSLGIDWVIKSAKNGQRASVTLTLQTTSPFWATSTQT